MRRLFIALAISGRLAISGSLAGEFGAEIYVASRSFLVSVAPVDQASENAESSLLYQSSAADPGWREIGICRKEILGDGTVRFLREVTVENDGAHHFTSRPVVGGKVADPPGESSAPQAIVVVDTLPPLAALTGPAGDIRPLPGESVRIAWKNEDENFPPLPTSLFYSTDGGKSWNRLGASLPAEGETGWTVPEDLAGPLLIRLAAVDKAGNLGRDSRRLEAGVPASPAASPAAIEQPEERQAEEAPPKAAEKKPEQGDSWLYYLMALNQMRQENPAEALRYYWLSVREDPDFIDAWADIGLAYTALGAYGSARDTIERTRDKAPERGDLMHLLGETYQAEGMELLAVADSPEKRLRAKGLIEQAAIWYGRALDRAAADWTLAEQAASFFRLGEICYYVNLDREGARAYWEKILKLHAPKPNPDLVLWTPEARRGEAEKGLRRDTARWVSLETWQNWARGYLLQLDARERREILELSPSPAPETARPSPLIYADNALNPGREDGRSLFSLPMQLGSRAKIPVAAGLAGPDRLVSRPGSPSGGYSFYAGKRSPPGSGMPSGPARAVRERSLFSGPPDSPPAAEPDPYAFPSRGRNAADWNRLLPYGNSPSEDW